jgi:hypothetical protein
LSGLVAGSLDILAAFLVYCLIKQATTPERLLQYIASGVFGQTAFSGGWQTALCGLAFHFLIAFSFAAFYVLVYPYIPFLKQRKVEAGLLYGILIWIVMNLLVLPLLFHNTPNFSWEAIGLGVGILMFCVGLPISLITREKNPEHIFN